MLKETSYHRYSRFTDGQANLALLAENQELYGMIAQQKGNVAAAEVHRQAARNFKAAISILHTAPKEALMSFNANTATDVVNKIILDARRKNKPAITMSSRTIGYQREEVANALNNVVIDEFSPTPAQLAQCEADAAIDALAELLPSGRTFNGSTFDPNSYEVYSVGDTGRLVLISKQSLATLTQKLFEQCSARVMMENIVNKKISEAGNFAAFSVMHNAGYQIAWNERVKARLFWQEQFVALTAKGTGLSQQNIRLVLENSAMNLNEQTPSEMIVSTGAQLIKTDTPIPTTLPPLGGNGSDGGVFDTEATTAGGLLIQGLATQNYALVVLGAGLFIAQAIFKAIEKRRREEIFKSLPDPSVIGPKCDDANEPNCEEGQGGNPPPAPTSTFSISPAAGLGMAAFAGLLFVSFNQNDVEQEIEA